MINAIPFKWVVKISRSVEMKKKRRVEKFEVLEEEVEKCCLNDYGHF